jgi:hypothetical protein
MTGNELEQRNIAGSQSARLRRRRPGGGTLNAEDAKRMLRGDDDKVGVPAGFRTKALV